MRRPAPLRGDCRGFTVIELVVTVSVLAIVLMACVVIATHSTKNIQTVVRTSDQSTKTSRVLESLDANLLAISLGSLEAPPAAGQRPIPLDVDVAVNELQFRRVESYDSTGPIYDPPVGATADRLYLRTDRGNANVGELVLERDGRHLVLVSDVTNLQFVLRDGYLEITFSFAATGRSVTHTIPLMNS